MQQPNPDVPAVHVQSPAFDERAYPHFILPTRMGYRWRYFNHRIAAWKFGLARNGDHPWADALRAHARGGPFSENIGEEECPRVKFGYQRIEVDSIERIGAARRKIDVTIGPDGLYRSTFSLDRDALHLSGYSEVVPIITGFGFDTSIPQSRLFPSNYHPGHGYLTRGIGAGVEVADLDDRSLDLDLWLRYGFGASMDRPHHNEALRDARVGAELDIALIGVSEVPVSEGRVDYEIAHDEEPKIGVEEQLPPAPERDKRLILQGTPRAPAGIWGIQAFNFALTPERDCRWIEDAPFGDDFDGPGGAHPEYGKPGFYIRELTLDLQQKAYDANSGEAAFVFDGYASNATMSIPFHCMHSAFTGRMVWLQTGGTTAPYDFSSAFETGVSDFAFSEMEKKSA